MLATAAPSGGRTPFPQTKSGLSSGRRRLVELSQAVNFGQFKGLPVHRGEPQFDPLPEIVYEVKLGAENGPRQELGNRDFVLKQSVLELFAYFDQHPDLDIEVLEVKHGLPWRMFVRHV